MSSASPVKRGSLSKTKGERVAEAFKALVGCLPIPVAPRLLEYLIDQCPFEHQQERIAEVAEQISEDLQNVTETTLQNMGQPEHLDRLNQVLMLAKFASYEEKRKRLSDVFIYSLSDERLEAIQKDQIVLLVSELEEPEIALLELYRLNKDGASQQERSQHIARYPEVLEDPPSSLLTVNASPQSTVVMERNHKIAWRRRWDANLERHGLVSYGGFTIHTQDNINQCEITEFGRLFLQAIKRNS